VRDDGHDDDDDDDDDGDHDDDNNIDDDAYLSTVSIQWLVSRGVDASYYVCSILTQ
jgi:hypothetical protein